MSRKLIQEEILEYLLDEAVYNTAFIIGFIEAGHGASVRSIEKKMSESYDEFYSFLKKNNLNKVRSYHSILSRLKRDGLVEKVESGWFITNKGKEKYKSLKTNLSRRRYEAETDDSLKIIIFDIPEEHRKKRDWLRGALKSLGFQFLQKSVWAGKKKLPEEFINDLKEHNLWEYVDIFIVSKTGSLEEVK